MSEYRALFDARGARYNEANRLHPEARAEEAARLFAHCGRPARGLWLDLGAGGGFLASRAAGLGIEAAAVGCDQSLTFLSGASGYALRAAVDDEHLPFSDGVFAASACLAALHHAEEPRRVLSEMLRVTGRGRAAVGDVAGGSPAARFLNGFVDANTDAGHAGRFYSPGELRALFDSAGGREARSEVADLHWRFSGRADARVFCRELFGLRPETPDVAIEQALDGLGLEGSASGWRLPWTMVFASAAGSR
jgi:SAM-dependent methyltransferase